VLQVGYRPNNLPCSFLTENGDLVGFDVEMAHILAQDLGVELEFVPFDFDALHRMLASGQIDLAMSCIASLPDRFMRASFTRPYLDLTLALIVRDYEREKFADPRGLREIEGLSIAMVSTEYFRNRVESFLPGARFVELEAAEDFFTDPPPADALLLSAQEGAAYTYRYPPFTVVPVGDPPVRLPIAYAVPKGDVETMEFVSSWIDLKRGDNTIDDLYEYWMLGGASNVVEPRWSVIRDVLGWVD
jgi:ABC-type amino acid transport substrate-binding protein